MTAEGGASETAPPPRNGRFEGLVEGIATALAIAGGVILIGLALLVTASVLGRWLLNREITGAFEVVQVGVAIAAFLFLPICQLHNQNIIVDSFTTRASPRLRAALDAFWACVYALIALVLAWRLSIGAVETIRGHMVTPMLRVPYGWAMVVGSAALCFLAVAALVVALRHVRGARA
jgi:TRAP-type C4-dicarboxylate transport system permease small subunit